MFGNPVHCCATMGISRPLGMRGGINVEGGPTVKPNSLSARIPTRGAPQAAMAPSKERSKAYICAAHAQFSHLWPHEFHKQAFGRQSFGGFAEVQCKTVSSCKQYAIERMHEVRMTLRCGNPPCCAALEGQSLQRWGCCTLVQQQLYTSPSGTGRQHTALSPQLMSHPAVGPAGIVQHVSWLVKANTAST